MKKNLVTGINFVFKNWFFIFSKVQKLWVAGNIEEIRHSSIPMIDGRVYQNNFETVGHHVRMAKCPFLPFLFSDFSALINVCSHAWRFVHSFLSYWFRIVFTFMCFYLQFNVRMNFIFQNFFFVRLQ